MNKINLIIHIIGCAVIAQSAFCEDTSYTTEENLRYYSEAITSSDSYIEERCVLDLYHPTNKDGFATVVWFHGGGLKAGEKHIADSLKRQGLAIVAVNYRLYPKAKAPSYLEDAAAAVAWTFKHIKSFGGDPEKIFVSGSSAGGYLTAMVGLDKRWLATHSIDADRIAGLIPLGGQMFTHFTIREERGIGKTTVVVDDLAPLSHLRADAPPILLVTGDREKEMLGRYEENAYMYRMLKVGGHPDVSLRELKGFGHAPQKPFYPLLLEEVDRVLQGMTEKDVIPPDSGNVILKKFSVKASQGVAVDGKWFYAISNTKISKCDKLTGKVVTEWVADRKKKTEAHFKHLNSGTVVGKKLYCAHSRFPLARNDCTVEIFDIGGNTLNHEKTIRMPGKHGSLTWIDQSSDGSWWMCYAVYGKDSNKKTKLVKYRYEDGTFIEGRSWFFPEAVVANWGTMSSSGGSWGRDGHLYITGHDRAEAYVLEINEAGELIYVRTEKDLGLFGQAIAWDRSSEKPVLWGIVKNKHISATLVPANRSEN